MLETESASCPCRMTSPNSRSSSKNHLTININVFTKSWVRWRSDLGEIPSLFPAFSALVPKGELFGRGGIQTCRGVRSIWLGNPYAAAFGWTNNHRFHIRSISSRRSFSSCINRSRSCSCRCCTTLSISSRKYWTLRSLRSAFFRRSWMSKSVATPPRPRHGTSIPPPRESRNQSFFIRANVPWISMTVFRTWSLRVF